jgi:hypothetical protein
VSFLYDQLNGSVETLFWCNAAAKAAVPVIALAGASYTALQYLRAQRWRAGDLAAQLVAQLTTDDELAFACQTLDWGVGPMIVPARFRPLMSRVPKDSTHPTPRELGEIMDHDTALMAKAVKVRLSFDLETQPAGLVYRFCFDKLFSHLANIHRLLINGQLRIRDLTGLTYWIRKIADYRYGPVQRRGGLMFQPFVGYEPFGYQGVRELGKKLGIEGWLPKPTPKPVSEPDSQPDQTPPTTALPATESGTSSILETSPSSVRSQDRSF